MLPESLHRGDWGVTGTPHGNGRANWRGLSVIALNANPISLHEGTSQSGVHYTGRDTRYWRWGLDYQQKDSQLSAALKCGRCTATNF